MNYPLIVREVPVRPKHLYSKLAIGIASLTLGKYSLILVEKHLLQVIHFLMKQIPFVSVEHEEKVVKASMIVMIQILPSQVPVHHLYAKVLIVLSEHFEEHHFVQQYLAKHLTPPAHVK